MDRYVRVEQRKTEQPSIQENEVRIMAAGKMRNYISYATTLLTVRQLSTTLLSALLMIQALAALLLRIYVSKGTEGGCGLQDKGHSAVVLKAMGRAINKTVTIGKPKPSSLNEFMCAKNALNQRSEWHNLPGQMRRCAHAV